MIKFKSLALSAAVLLAAAAVAPARSQISPLGPDGFALPRSDLTLLGAAEAKLYDPATKVGATQRWSNPDTEDGGTVTLISTFERDGMACRRLAHNIKVHGLKGERQFVISRCHQPDGSWKIVP
jgi:surface antigen